MRLRTTARGLCLALSAALELPASASAHGIAGREDLPLPAWIVGWAAAAVLIVSFVGLAVLWSRPRLERASVRRLLVVPLVVQVVLGLIGVSAFAVTVYAGFAGSQVDTANLAPTAIFVAFWVLIPFASVIFGDLFSLCSPWRAVGRGAGFLAGRVRPGGLPEPMPYPDRLGRWPAVATVLAFGWVELVSPDRGDPSFLAALAVVYAALQLIGMSLYGERAWTKNADGFAGVFALFGSLSPLRWADGELSIRPPLSGAARASAGTGFVALLCSMIAVTAFDGFSQSGAWLSAAPRLQDAFVTLGFSKGVALQLAGTVGLLFAWAVVYGLYWIGIDGIRGVAGERGKPGTAQAFAHSLIPIAAGYLAAHYLSFAAFQGQALAYLVSDPLGHGSDLFGTASRSIDYGWIGGTTIWYLQAAALVAGHVGGLVLAHDRALARYPDARIAIRSQYWMLAVMVSFTCLGLWLLSSIGS